MKGLAISLLLLLSLLGASPAQSADKWQEAVLVVADGDVWHRFFTEVAGWRQRFCDAASNRELRRLGSRARQARECLYANRGDRRGWVRVIEVGPLAAASARIGTMPWDTGGFFSLMFYGADLDRSYAAAAELGFDSVARPIFLSAGSSQLKNVVLEGPDGINIAIYQRLSPPLTAFPNMKQLSTAFNSMMMVSDVEAMEQFVEDVLDFDRVGSGNFVDPERGENNFGLPQNWADIVARRFSIYGPETDLDGRVELLKFIGLEGRAVNPGREFHRGILALRFPVDDLSAALEATDAKPIRSASRARLRPYGNIRIATFVSPEGGRFELMEILDD